MAVKHTIRRSEKALETRARRTQRENLQVHLVKQRPPVGERMFRCVKCGAAFFDEKSLISHHSIGTCSEEGEWYCSDCGSVVKDSKEALLHHVATCHRDCARATIHGETVVTNSQAKYDADLPTRFVRTQEQTFCTAPGPKPPGCTIRILSWNCCSLGPEGKIEVIQYMIDMFSVDVICVQETWLRTDEGEKAPDIPGFRLVARKDGTNGAQGVATFVRIGDDLRFWSFPERCPAYEGQAVRTQIIKLVNGEPAGSLDLTNVYTPPLTNVPTVLPDLPELGGAGDNNAALKKHVLIVGDMNARHPQWDRNIEDGDSTKAGKRGRIWLEWATKNGAEILNDPNSATRITEWHTTSPDIWVSRGEADCVWYRGPPTGGDHLPTLGDVHFQNAFPAESGQAGGENSEGRNDEELGEKKRRRSKGSRNDSSENRKKRTKGDEAAGGGSTCGTTDAKFVYNFRKALWPMFQRNANRFFRCATVALALARPTADLCHREINRLSDLRIRAGLEEPLLDKHFPNWIRQRAKRVLNGDCGDPDGRHELDTTNEVFRAGLAYAAVGTIPRAREKKRSHLKVNSHMSPVLIDLFLQRSRASAQRRFQDARDLSKRIEQTSRKERQERFEEKVGEIDWSSSGLSKAHKLIHEIQGTAVAPGANSFILRHRGKDLVTDSEKAEALATMYTSELPTLGANDDPEARPSPAESPVSPREANQPSSGKEARVQIDSGTVASAIWAFEDKSSPGPDGIVPVQLKNLGDGGVEFLRHMIERSVNTGLVPSAWKRAIVAPLPKPGKRTDEIKNYRPISLTSIVAKVSERCLVHKLEDYCAEDPAQWGGRKGHGTGDAVAQLVGSVERHRASGLSSAGLFLDASSAFDRVPIPRVLAELQNSGVPPVLTTWVGQFLSGRTLCVKYGNSISKVKEVTQGAPQGTILGPWVWRIFLKPLLAELAAEGVEVIAYVDDLLILEACTSAENGTRALQKGATICDRWASNNNMSFSPTKSKMVFFPNQKGGLPECEGYKVDVEAEGEEWEKPVYKYIGGGGQALAVMMGGQPLQFVSGIKYLGMVVDPGLNFQVHIAWVLSRCQRRLGAIRRLCGARWALGRHVKMLYVALIVSLIQYNAGVYMPCAHKCRRGALQGIDNMLATGARLAIRAGSRSHALGAITACGLPTSDNMMREGAATVVSKIMHRANLQGDPLRHVALFQEAPWAKVGREALAEAGIPIEKMEPRFSLEGRSVRGYWGKIISGQARMILGEATEVDVAGLLATCAWVVFTDGSVADFDGSSSVVIFPGVGKFGPPNADGTACETWCDSFTAEREGLRGAMQAILHNSLRGDIAVLTDSQSNLATLSMPFARTRGAADIMEKIVEFCEGNEGSSVRFQFVRGHAGILGNEMADSVANNCRVGGDLFGKVVPLHLAKSRVKAASRLQQQQQLQTRGGYTADQLLRLGYANPCLAAGAQRRFGSVPFAVDAAYNQLFLGLAPFGMMRHVGDGVLCALCRKVVPRRMAVCHILFGCPAVPRFNFFRAVLEGDRAGPSWGDIRLLKSRPLACLSAIGEILE